MPAEAGTPTEKAKRAYAAAMERFRLRDGAGALDLLREAITHDPKFAEGYNAMAGVLKSAKRLPAAIAILQRGIEVAPTTATLYSNLGNLLWSDFRFAEAAAALHRAIEIDPAQAAAWHNLGLLCYSLGDSGRAIECYDRALERTKTQVAIRWDRSLALLARGEFERGFADYESRLEYRPQLKSSLPIPIWQGEPLSGRRLLLHYEQGLGDTLQFGRFIRGLLARGGEVHLVCQPELIRLFRPLPGLASVLDPASSMPAVDFQIGLASLPLRLGASLKTLPEAHYLSPAPGVDGPPIPKGPGTRLAVGLVWAGNPAQENDANRSMPLEPLLSLCGIQGVALYSLQHGPRAGDIAQAGARALVHDVGSALADMAETAAAMMKLDLIITVCTATAHLAGALARPGMVLLCHRPDWRWMDKGETSPWYPTLRLFRQKEPKDWAGVMRQVAAAVAARAASIS